MILDADTMSGPFMRRRRKKRAKRQAQHIARVQAHMEKIRAAQAPADGPAASIASPLRPAGVAVGMHLGPKPKSRATIRRHARADAIMRRAALKEARMRQLAVKNRLTAAQAAQMSGGEDVKPGAAVGITVAAATVGFITTVAAYYTADALTDMRRAKRGNKK